MKSSTYEIKCNIAGRHLFTATYLWHNSEEMNSSELEFAGYGVTKGEARQHLRNEIDEAIAELTLAKKQLTD